MTTKVRADMSEQERRAESHRRTVESEQQLRAQVRADTERLTLLRSELRDVTVTLCGVLGLNPHDALSPPPSAPELAQMLAAEVESFFTLVQVGEYEQDDDGEVLWWRVPIEEPPYCGTPGDSTWPDVDDDYFTHYTRFPVPDPKS